MGDYARPVPTIDPHTSPVGLVVVFIVLSLIVLGLFAAAIAFVIGRFRERQLAGDPAARALEEGFSGVEAEQRRLDEQLAKMRAQREPRNPSD